MPKSVEDILANAENLSKRIREFEPSKKDEKEPAKPVVKKETKTAE